MSTTNSEDIHISKDKIDSIVHSVISQLVNRSYVGKTKYGTDLDRTDLSTLDWIQHAQEELMDATLYLEKLKKCYMASVEITNNNVLDNK